MAAIWAIPGIGNALTAIVGSLFGTQPTQQAPAPAPVTPVVYQDPNAAADAAAARKRADTWSMAGIAVLAIGGLVLLGFGLKALFSKKPAARMPWRNRRRS